PKKAQTNAFHTVPQKTKGKRQKAKGKRLKDEGRGRKLPTWSLPTRSFNLFPSYFCLLPFAFSFFWRGRRLFLVPEQVPRNNDLLNPVRPFADLTQLRVPEKPLHRKLSRVSISAVDLDGRVARFHRGLGREQLRLRALQGSAFPLLLQVRGAQREQPGG